MTYIRLHSLLIFSLCFFFSMDHAFADDTDVITGSQTPKLQAVKKIAGQLTSTADDMVPVIIVFREDYGQPGKSFQSVTTAKRLLSETRRRVLSSLGGDSYERIRDYEYLPLAALQVNRSSLEKLAVNPEIVGIFENKRKKLLLSESVPLVKADKAWSKGFSGSGQVVAIIDNGVDNDHPMLVGKVVAEACFSADFSCSNGEEEQFGSGSADVSPGQDNHGTHVAGIVAGIAGDNYLNGVAKDAGILALKVDSANGSMWDSDILAGLDYVYGLSDSFNIAAVNLSLGGDEFFTSYCDYSPYKEAFDKLRSVGIAPVVASGNEYQTDRLSEPACVSSAVSVGAVTKNDQVWSGSNSSSRLDMLAPGVNITSASIYDEFSSPDNNVATETGTSMATPHVAGAFAVLKSIKPEASVDEIEETLKEGGKMILDRRNYIRKPRIDVEAAMYLLKPSLKQQPQTQENSNIVPSLMLLLN